MVFTRHWLVVNKNVFQSSMIINKCYTCGQKANFWNAKLWAYSELPMLEDIPDSYFVWNRFYFNNDPLRLKMLRFSNWDQTNSAAPKCEEESSYLEYLEAVIYFLNFPAAGQAWYPCLFLCWVNTVWRRYRRLPGKPTWSPTFPPLGQDWRLLPGRITV